jgi:hypothetical protein
MGVIEGCNFFGGKIWQTLAAMWAGALSCNKKNSRKQKSSFRIRRTTVLGIFKDSAIVIDAIRPSFLNKLGAKAAMFTSVRVDFGWPPLSSSSTSSLLYRNREYHLKRLNGSEPNFHKPFAPISVFLLQIDRLLNKILWQLSVNFCHP